MQDGQDENYIQIELRCHRKEAQWLFQFGVPKRYVFLNDEAAQDLTVTVGTREIKCMYNFQFPRDVPLYDDIDRRHYKFVEIKFDTIMPNLVWNLSIC